MPKTKISEFSSTPSANTDINGINTGEGMIPSDVNNAIRELMAELKNQQAGTDGSDFTVGNNLTVTGNMTVNAQGDVRFADADSSNWVAFQAPATVSSNVTWTLPAVDGSAGAVLKTNGSGTLSFSDAISNQRINPRVSTTTSTASITPDISSFDQYCVTAQAANLTINAPTGTPVDGNKLIFRILDNGTSRTLTWNSTYTAIQTPLPTGTTVNKTTYVGCIYNANNTRWDVIAVATQA